MCFIISYYLFLGVADKNLTIIFTNTNISWNHMSGDILGGNRSQLSPLPAQYMHRNELFQNWTPTRWGTPLVLLLYAVREWQFSENLEKWLISVLAQALAGVKLWICSELELLALRGLKENLVPMWTLKWFGHLRFTCLSSVYVLFRYFGLSHGDFSHGFSSTSCFYCIWPFVKTSRVVNYYAVVSTAWTITSFFP